MPPFTTAETIAYSQLLAASFTHWMGRTMMDDAPTDPIAFAHQLFHAPFALLSHGTQVDPIFRYVNQTALDLWEMEWDTFTQLPSRMSAQPISDIQDERQQLLKAALQNGCVDDYQGIRISKNGQRFEISDTTLWNVVDANGMLHGQAALIRHWAHL